MKAANDSQQANKVLNTSVDGMGLNSSGLVSSEVKTWWVKSVWGGIEGFFLKTGISPNTITFIGLGLTCVAGALIAHGHLILGGWMVFVAGSFDFLDGRIARITGMQGVQGAFLDSVMDRYMDAAVLVGIAFYFSPAWPLWLVFAAMLGAFTTSYIRAKAESLGVSCHSGLMQRPERIIFLGLGCLISGYWEVLRYPFEALGWRSYSWPLVMAVFLVAFFSNLTAIQRFRSVYLDLKRLSKSVSVNK